MIRSAKTLAVLLLLVTASVPVTADETTSIGEHERWVTSLAFSPDGALLATAGGQSLQYRPGDVILWDAKSGNQVAALEGHTSNVWSIAFSPDGKTLITSGYDGKVIVWSVEEKKSTATLEKHKGWCRSVAINPAGTHFATAGEDGTAVVWELAGPKEVKELKAHEAAIYHVAFSPDGNTLATASTDKTVKLWDWQSGKENAKLEGHEDAVWAVAFHGDMIATGGADRTLRLWEASGKAVAALPGHGDWISGVTFSPDGTKIATSSLDRTVRIWVVSEALAAAEPLTQAIAKVKESKTQLQQADDAIADAEPKIEPAKKKADILGSVAKARVAAELLAQVTEVANKFKDVSFVKVDIEGAKKASDDATKAADEAAKPLAGDKPFTELVTKLKAGPAAEAEKERAAAAKVAADLEAKLTQANKTKDGATEALANAQAKLKELSGKQSQPLNGFSSTVWSVAFSPDGKLLASGSHKALRAWDLSQPKELFPRAAKEEESSEEESGEEESGE